MTEIRLNHDTILSRKDLETIASMIPGKSRSLDLGCGSGRLLKFLAQLKEAKVMGVEKEQDKVIECTGRGVPVIQADLNAGLPDFADNSYDFVILSQTLQAVKRPDLLLDEMFRVGKTGIISFLNFGHCSARRQLLFGDMPETKTLPWKWYDTPNIHLATIADFRRLCRQKAIRILREIPLTQDGDPFAFLAGIWPNLFSSTCVFILEK